LLPCYIKSSWQIVQYKFATLKKKDAEDYMQNIKTYVAILVNIGMEAKRVKFDSGRFEGVVRRELQSQLVGKPLIYSSSAALDGTNP
jgi:hypothetical protein